MTFGLWVFPHGGVNEAPEILRIWSPDLWWHFRRLRLAIRKRADISEFVKKISLGRNDAICVDLSHHNNAVPPGTLELFQRFHREVGEQAVGGDVHHDFPLRISIRHRVRRDYKI